MVNDYYVLFTYVQFCYYEGRVIFISDPIYN